MVAVSASVDFAWQVAADEAMHSLSANIEPCYLMIGLCSIEKLIARKSADSPVLYDQPEVLAEFEVWVQSLRKVGLDAQLLRRAIRASLPPVTGALPLNPSQGLRRSAASLAIFERARQIAGQANLVQLADFANALLENKDPYIDAALIEFG